MDAFSYLSVLLSIIIGLAIAQVLQGYRAILLSRPRVQLDATTLIWSVILIVLATQAWWSSFDLREQAEWGFLSFAIVLLQMIFLYMMAAVALPDIGKGETVELAPHFHDHRRAFFGFLAGMLMASVAKDVVLNGSLPAPSNLLFHGLGLGTAIAGMTVASRRAQLGLAISAALALVVYVALLFAHL